MTSTEPNEAEVVEDIDEKRADRKTYEYLCRLLEVRNWLAECLQDDSIPSVTELEENFRNGVVLARLGNSFAPTVVTIKNIYDITQEKYVQNENIPLYRHTDNIMLWRKAMESVRLPEIVIPETVDVFEGRNMKTIFCLYALATLLYRLRKAPAIRNLAGKAVFTQSELDEMKGKVIELKLPEFGDVGGFLSDMSADEKAQAAAIHRINIEIENGVADQLLIALQDADAGILYLEKELKEEYLTDLLQEKQKEENNTLNKKKIQDAVVNSNNLHALKKLEDLLNNSDNVDSNQLIRLLDILQFEQIKEFAISLYISILLEKKAEKNGELTREEIFEALTTANALAEVKIAVQQGSSKDVLKALSQPVLNLQPNEENSKLYFNRLYYLYEKSEPEFFVRRNELENIIYEFGDLSTEKRTLLELKASCSRNDHESIEVILRDICGNIYIEENIEYYVRRLNKESPQSNEHLKEIINDTNEKVTEAFSAGDTVVRLNKALHDQDPTNTRLNLIGLTSALNSKSYRPELIHWYVNRLMLEGKKRNIYDIEDPKKEMWLEQSFLYGDVYVEITEHRKSTKKQKPISSDAVTWPLIEEIIDAENESFDMHYNTNEEKVKKSQEAIRHYLDNKKKKEEIRKSEEQDKAARKIQDNYKKYKERKDHDKLKSVQNPSLSLVRKFVGALHQRENDLEQELELEQFKSRVWHLRVANQQLDGSLQDLDNKIGLLVKNRLNLQDVIEQKNKIADENEHFKNRPASIRKKAKDQQEWLEQLMYHFQADSKFLANLIQSDERREITDIDLLRDCVAPIFGFITEKREEFLLVRLLCEVVLRNVEHSTAPSDILQSKDKDFIRDVLLSNMFDVADRDPCIALRDELKDFVTSGRKLVFNLDPVSIYGKGEIDIETALTYPNVKQILDGSIAFLSEWSNKFVQAIVTRYQLPNCILYLTSYLNDILIRQFPTVSRADITRTVGDFIFEVYFHAFLTSRRAVFRASGVEMDDSSCHLLEVLVQFIDYGIKNRGYGNAKYFLSILNKDIRIINDIFGKYITNAIDGIVLEDIYGFNEYTHFDPAHKPTLTLTEKQLAVILKYMKINAPVITTGTGQHLHNLLANCSAPERSSDEKSVWLQLHPMRVLSEEGTVKQELFIRTKKNIVDLLLSGLPGTTIEQLIVEEPSPREEKLHNDFYNPDNCSIKEKQQQIIEGLKELESVERVTSQDHYQQIVTDIANDIRLATRRRKERAEVHVSLQSTEKKLQQHRDELNQRLTQYEEYLDTCLDNLSRTSKRMSFRPDTKSAGKIQKQRLSLDTPMSIRSTMEKLLRKKIIINTKIQGFDNQKKVAKLNVEIATSDKKGVFLAAISDGKTNVQTLEVDFQDLLQREAVQNTMWIDNAVEVDVITLKNYLNRKFYSK